MARPEGAVTLAVAYRSAGGAVAHRPSAGSAGRERRHGDRQKPGEHQREKDLPRGSLLRHGPGIGLRHRPANYPRGGGRTC
jgi:hypothetical protein